MRSDIKQKRRHFHQRIHRGPARRRTHGLYPRLIRTDKDSALRNGLRQRHRQNPYRRRIPPGMGKIRPLRPEMPQHRDDRPRILHGKLSGRRRQNHAHRAHCNPAVQAQTSDRISGRNARHSIKLYLLAQTRRQSENERTLRRLPPHFRLKKRNDVDRRRRRHGAPQGTDHAHDQDPPHHRPQDELLLRRPCAQRSFLPPRLPRTRKRIPQLQIPSRPRPPRPGGRRRRSEIHPGLRPSGHLRHIS